MLKLGSLFSGIGGIELGFERTGRFKTIWNCEIEPYPSAVLEKNFPGVKNYGDITKVDWSGVERPDVLVGGFPCQDISVAGKGAGIKEGTRSGLWSEYARAIRELRPRYVVVENVRRLLSGKSEVAYIPFRCVCGWTGGRGGMHQYNDIHEPLREDLLPTSGHRDDGEGTTGSPRDTKTAWRKPAKDAGTNREVGDCVCVGIDRGESSCIPPMVVPPLGSKERTCGDSDSMRDLEDMPLVDEGTTGTRDVAEGTVAGFKPEGTHNKYGMVCEACGRRLDYATNFLEPWLCIILTDLAQAGYSAEWRIISAASVGAPHRRERLFIIAHDAAHADHNGALGQARAEEGGGRLQAEPHDDADAPDPAGVGLHPEEDKRWMEGEGRRELLAREPGSVGQADFAVFRGIINVKDLFNRPDIPEPLVRRANDGVPSRLDNYIRTERTKALGNAVVPQVAQVVAERVLAMEGGSRKTGSHLRGCAP